MIISHSTHPFIRRSLACAALALLAISGVAATIQDQFRTQQPEPIWQVMQDGMSLKQGGNQLRLSLPAPGVEDPAFAAYFSKNYGFDLSRDWNLSFNYALQQGAISSPGIASGAMLLMLIPSQEMGMGVVAPIVYRSKNGTFVGLLTVVGEGQLQVEPITSVASSGTLKVSYQAQGRYLSVSVNGRGARRSLNSIAPATSSSPYALWGIGGVTIDPGHSFSFTNGISISKFSASGQGLVPGAFGMN